MESADPQDKPGAKPGKKRCGAKLRNKPGKRCQSDKLMPNGRCRLHGGKTPSGPGSPNWKHGQRAKAHRWMGSLPAETLGKRFDAALADPMLMTLRQDMALADAMLTSYTASLRDTGRALTATQQERVHKLIAMRATLAEKEARRLRDLGTMVTQVQFMVVVNTCIQLFTEFVTDPKARQEVHRRLQQALVVSGRRVEDGEGGD